MSLVSLICVNHSALSLVDAVGALAARDRSCLVISDNCAAGHFLQRFTLGFSSAADRTNTLSALAPNFTTRFRTSRSASAFFFSGARDQ
jgi:hypothetical protein